VCEGGEGVEGACSGTGSAFHQPMVVTLSRVESIVLHR
jgi:hypothetical protein